MFTVGAHATQFVSELLLPFLLLQLIHVCGLEHLGVNVRLGFGCHWHHLLSSLTGDSVRGCRPPACAAVGAGGGGGLFGH